MNTNFLNNHPLNQCASYPEEQVVVVEQVFGVAVADYVFLSYPPADLEFPWKESRVRRVDPAAAEVPSIPTERRAVEVVVVVDSFPFLQLSYPGHLAAEQKPISLKPEGRGPFS